MPEAPDRPRGEVFLDARGNGRAMRLTWHHETELVVLSLWRDGTCASTFRLARDDVNEFIDALVDGLRDAPGVHIAPPETGETQLPERSSIATGAGPTYAEMATQTLPRVEAAPTFTEWAFGDTEPLSAG